MLVQLIKPEFQELIEARDWVALKEVLTDVAPADIAELLVELDGDVAVVVFRLLKKSTAGDVFAELPSGKGVELIDIKKSNLNYFLITFIEIEDLKSSNETNQV